MSPAYTERAPSAAVVMTCWLPNVPLPSVFSYQAILPPPYQPRAHRVSPSPSTSSTYTDSALPEVTTSLRAKLPFAVRIFVPRDLAVEAGCEHIKVTIFVHVRCDQELVRNLLPW